MLISVWVSFLSLKCAISKGSKKKTVQNMYTNTHAGFDAASLKPNFFLLTFKHWLKTDCHKDLLFHSASYIIYQSLYLDKDSKGGTGGFSSTIDFKFQRTLWAGTLRYEAGC